MSMLSALLCIAFWLPGADAAKSKLAPAMMTQKLPIPEYKVEAIGTMPPWLKGTLYRNVPNTYEAGEDQVWSWVDALASMHSMKFDGTSSVLHQAKMLDTPARRLSEKEGRFTQSMFMTPAKGGRRPTGGHVPFPCNGPSGNNPDKGGACKAEPPSPPVLDAKVEASSGFNVEKEETTFLRRLASASQETAKGWAASLLDSLPSWPKVGVNSNPNVNLARYVLKNGTEVFMALTDQTIYTSFEGTALETTESGPCPWKDAMCSSMLASAGLTSAHEKFDYKTGEHFNFVGELGLWKFTYKLIKYKDGQDSLQRWSGPTFTVKDLSFIHSSHLTEKYFIIQQPPANYQTFSLMLRKPAFNASFYDAEMPTLWHVIDRTTGELVKTYDADNIKWTGRQLTGQTMFRGQGHPGSVMHSHTVNAFEEADGSITMDFIGWPDMSIFYGIGLELINDNPRDYQETWEPARLTRCILQTKASYLTCEIIVDSNFGLPNFNVENYQSKPYNFVYGTSISSKAVDFVDVLSKVDIDKRTISHTWTEEGCFVTEPVFVAKPGATTEDEGVVLSAIFDSKKVSSYMVVLDAKDMSELARFHLGYKIQAHYHGKFCKAFGDKTCVGS